MSRIVLVSLACRYPDAASPEALWANVSEGRRAFRALPPERLDLARYAAELVGEADSITKVKVGLLTDWHFDHARYRIPYATFVATDLTHWLALEVASDAIERAGGINILDRDRTAVVVANTLTGEFSRASLLRLRGPFIDDLIAQAAEEAGLEKGVADRIRHRFGAALRERFPEPQEDTLAGGLANTIAGRIANYFDLHGGAYSVDAACASSLVALADAANLLMLGDVDAAVVGAVDLSLDPFELVGFSRNGALARDDMRVFDAQSSGFWPGEGAGFALLMREDDARQRGLPIHAILRGWGISSDGAGGFTRPDEKGQLRALRRAYEKAAVDPADLGYVEAHGTGTAVGDPVEVRALAGLCAGAPRALPIGSIKANIGHTKAASGFAGLIKTVAALEAGIVPPHVGCTVPHPVFREVDDTVRPALSPEAWPVSGPRVAGVSGFGFGGVNAHIVLERAGRSRPMVAIPAAPLPQDAELFVFAGETAADVQARMTALAHRANTMSRAELTDAAAGYARVEEKGQIRAAVVARDTEELASGLASASEAIAQARDLFDATRGLFVARRSGPPCLGFLFPGQAAPSRPEGGLWARRFEATREIVRGVPAGADPADTSVAQPAVAAASLAALRILRDCGIEACAAVGHSLGELSALAWAGAIDDDTLVQLAAKRGAIVSANAIAGGAMLRVVAPGDRVRALAQGLDVTLACDNGPGEIVVSGARVAVDAIENRARRAGIETTQLLVSHAFHSPMMQPAVLPFSEFLSTVHLHHADRPVFSTVTGAAIGTADDLAILLARQLVLPVRFTEALGKLAAQTDLLIEVGPGFALSRLAGARGLRAVSTDAFGSTLAPLLAAIGACFTYGSAVRLAPLFDDRPKRAFDLAAMPRFIENPCGRRESSSRPPLRMPASRSEIEVYAPAVLSSISSATDTLELVRGLLAEETRLPLDHIGVDQRFLDHLHLNSLAVARIVVRAARAIGITAPRRPTDFANATPLELAAALIELRDLAPEARGGSDYVAGVRPWLRNYAMRWFERPAANFGDVKVRWRILAVGAIGDGSTAPLVDASDADADGVLVWLDDDFDHSASIELFKACQAAWRDERIKHLAICHDGAPVSAFARSLAMEERFRSVRVIERSRDVQIAAVRGELGAEIAGYSEKRLDGKGRRFEPEFIPTEPRSGGGRPIGPSDVVLVTGGAKGIGAECALRLAERTAAAIVLVGRSSHDDSSVVATLERAKAMGIRCCYTSADVTNPAYLARVVAENARDFGPVSVLIHAAGVNAPDRFGAITIEEFERTLAVKTKGLLAAIAASGEGLRRVIAFGSLIGCLGLEGEAHYALANAWQTAVCERLAAERPELDVLALEWSVWNGVGMGEPRGTVERLKDKGVDPLPVDDALAAFERLVLEGATGAVAVTSRFGPPPNLAIGPSELPILRFVDEPRVHFPGVELVVETELSRGRDPYLADHRLGRHEVWPGALALEAMAQVASALHAGGPPSVIEHITFRSAVIVPEGGSAAVRIAALVRRDGRIDVVIRAAEDEFATDRMSATFVFAATETAHCRFPQATARTDLDAASLYGPLFFQRGGFRRIMRYEAVSARQLVAVLASDDGRSWFSGYDPSPLVLGDPGARDAMLHALQAAVPHKRVVPVSAERVVFRSGAAPARIEASEQSATDDTFTFDIHVYDGNGKAIEEWHNVTFHALETTEIDAVLSAAPPLTAAYLERVARAVLTEPSIEVAFVSDPSLGVAHRRDMALSVLRLDRQVATRGDGKPIVIAAGRRTGVSFSHRGAATLAVRAECEIGCDLEAVSGLRGDGSDPLDPKWTRALLSRHVVDAPIDRAGAATRLWTLAEATLKKGESHDLSPHVNWKDSQGAILFETAFGKTVTIRLRDVEGDLIVAIGTRLQPAEQLRGPVVRPSPVTLGGVR